MEVVSYLGDYYHLIVALLTVFAMIYMNWESKR